MPQIRNEAEAIFKKIAAGYTITNARNDWTEYRRAVTDYIINNSDEGASLAILGAGRCNDLDINRLGEHFGSITLVDRDIEALNAVNAEYAKGSGRAVLKLLERDFVGISYDSYIDYTAAVITELRSHAEGETETAAAGTESVLARIYGEREGYRFTLPEQYDYVTAIGVCSQLNSMPAHISEALGMEEVPEIISSRTDRIVRDFLDTAFSAAEKAVFTGDELLRLPDSYCIDGAIQSLSYIEELAEKGQLAVPTHMSVIWPFDPARGRFYEMVVYKIIENNGGC